MKLASYVVWSVILILGACTIPATAATEHLVFLRDSPQETHVYRVRGRDAGPTVMLLGGIHGDEPGAYLSADCYVDANIKKGTLLVVPRSNFRSITHNQRGFGGDMNRKFQDSGDDPELAVVALLKSLMAESDLVLTLHDGSGFYRPAWESEAANPKRYGQSIIIDAAEFSHEGSGKTLALQAMADAVLARVNPQISDPMHRFHIFNMRTGEKDSPHKEHRDSATWYSITRLGVPAFCIETSKQLPSLMEKVRQHNLVINAFLEEVGVELDQPFALARSRFSHLVMAVDDTLPIAVASGQTLAVRPQSTVRLLQAAAVPDRGILVSRDEPGRPNLIGKILTIQEECELTVRQDAFEIGRVRIRPVEDGDVPRIEGSPLAAVYTEPGVSADLSMLDGTALVAAAERPHSVAQPTGTGPVSVSQPPDAQQDFGRVTGFLVQVDGKDEVIPLGASLPVRRGAKLTLVDILSDAPLPSDTVMNLRGFVSKANEIVNRGEDRGATADTARDMLPAFSEKGLGQVYAINAELGKTVLGSARIKITEPRLRAVTVRYQGEERRLGRGSRTPFVAGQTVELLRIDLEDDLPLGQARFTLAGKPVPVDLPQRVTMREIAINLAVFDGDVLTGKVTWLPVKPDLSSQEVP